MNSHFFKAAFPMLILATLASTDAFSRSYREGFNFGTNLRLRGALDQTSGSESNFDSEQQTSHDMIEPHLGYAFSEYFDFGLGALFESQTSLTNITNSDQSLQSQRKSEQSLEGMHLYIRFLFADVMFFQASAGGYRMSGEIEETTKSSNSSGDFTGSTETYTMKAEGFGYSLGGGVDIPMTKGFFFRTTYQNRHFYLKHLANSGNIGRAKSNITRNEINFGLVHFLD